jgi:GNAT superfamily N-acetyltransferase
LRIAREPFDEALVAESARELFGRYGADTEPGGPPRAVDVFLVARDDDGQVLGFGALRRVDADTLEIKRMYTRPAARGRGVARAVLAALEAEARVMRARRLVLETGPLQPEAVALYESAGYTPIPCFGPYAGSELSRCYERTLSSSSDSAESSSTRDGAA